MSAIDVLDQSLGVGAPTAVLGLVGYYFKVVRPARKSDQLAKIARDQKNDEVYYLLVGRKPTELEPTPPKGLVAKVDAIANQPDVVAKLTDNMTKLTTTVTKISEGFDERVGIFETVVADVSHLKDVVASIDSKAASVAQGVAELVFDKGTNGGSTTRDAIDRLEVAVGSKPSGPESDSMLAQTHDEQSTRVDPNVA